MPDDFHVLCQCHIVICEILQSIPVITAFRWQQFFVHQSLLDTIIMPPPLIGGGIKRWCCLTSVCLSVAYIGPKSRTERPRKTKIGTEVAHATRDSDTTYKVKRSKVKVTRQLCSLPCWRVRRLQQWAWERVGRGKLLLCCSLLCSARRFGAHGGGEGRGHILAAARLQVVGRRIRL